MEKLADIAGRCEALVARLKRHAGLCAYPGIAQGVREVAGKEAGHESALRSILAGEGRWPRPPESAAREGSSNWERLNGDLAMLLALMNELRRHALSWGNADPALAERLTKIADEAGESEADLRQLAAKCDPQAID